MQFSVPQFTDVEDRIIGPLTLKQFGIVFSAGIIIFAAYSATKSIIVLVFFGLLFGIPALALAFGKLNGRPMYHMISFFFKFLASSKVLIFHKETTYREVKPAKDQEKTVIARQVEVSDPKARLKAVQRLLEEQATKEREYLKIDQK